MWIIGKPALDRNFFRRTGRDDQKPSGVFDPYGGEIGKRSAPVLLFKQIDDMISAEMEAFYEFVQGYLLRIVRAQIFGDPVGERLLRRRIVQ